MPRVRLKTLLVLMAGFALLLGAARAAWNYKNAPGIPIAKVEQLRLGMPRVEVEAIIGKPTFSSGWSVSPAGRKEHFSYFSRYYPGLIGNFFCSKSTTVYYDEANNLEDVRPPGLKGQSPRQHPDF